MKKIGIITGHSLRSQGARAYNNASEYDFNKTVSQMIESIHIYKSDYLNSSVDITFLDRNAGWDNLVSKVRNLDLDATIELHFNSFKSAAYGVECLCYSDESCTDSFSLELAKRFSKIISNHYDSKARGVMGAVELEKGDRGSYNLRCMAEAGVLQSIIIEPCFANFETEESKKIIGNPLEYANVLYKAIEDYFGGSDES